LASLASLAGVIGTSVAPAGAGTNGLTTYEVDCVGTGLAAGQTAPFIEGLNVNTFQAGVQVDALDPRSSFDVSGTKSVTLIGPIIAGAEQVVNLSTFGLGATVSQTIGSTDGSATGSFVYNHSFPNHPVNGRQITGVSWTAGSTALTAAAGTFLASDVGFFVAGPTGTIDPNSTITAVAADGSSATISLATLAAATGATIGLGQTNTFVDPTFSTGDVFTTDEVSPANIGITSMSSITLIVVPGVIQATFGGSPGVGSANCLLTGYDAAGNPGPSQFGDTTPADPVLTHDAYVAAGITPLVLASGGFIVQPGTTQAITPPAAAFTNVACSFVTADATATIDRNISNTTMLTLPVGDTCANPVASCSVVSGSISDPRLTASISNSPTPCVATLTDTDGASTGATVTFNFIAVDTAGNPSTPAGGSTVTVTIVPIPHVAITTTSLPDALVGVPYSATLTATGGTPPYTWSITSGSLPPGLSLDPTTGVISGTPTTAGVFTFTAMVTDSDTPAETATASLSFTLPRCGDVAMNVIVGNPRAAAGHKTVVAKVTNVGTDSCTVSDTNISWSMTVAGTDVTGTVTPLNPGTVTLGPGANKRFRFNWDYGTALTGFVGQTVDITATVTVAGDANAANNSDTEIQTVK
jgi:hypothetical protein